MENNLTVNEQDPTDQDYLKYLPLMIKVSAILTLLSFTSQYYWRSHRNAYEGFLQNTYFLQLIVYKIAFWFIIYKVFQIKKASLYALLLSLSVILISYISFHYFIEENIRFNIQSQLMWSVLAWLPFFVFCYMTFPKKYWIYSLLLTFLVGNRYLEELGSGILSDYVGTWIDNNTISSHFGRNFGVLDIALEGNSSTPINWLQYIYVFICHVASFTGVVSFIHYLKNFDFGFKDKLLNLNNTYKGYQSIILYLCYKIYIICIAFGLWDIIRKTISSNRYNLEMEGIVIHHPAWYFVKLTLLTLVGLYVIVWAYRKFLLEVLYSKGVVPSWSYWLIQIPFIGSIIYLVIWIRDGVSVPVSKRVKAFINSIHNNKYTGIALLITIVSSIFLFLEVINTLPDDRKVSGIFTGFAGIVMFLVSIKSKIVYYFNIILALSFALYLSTSEQSQSFMIAILILQVVMLYILMGIFHIEKFYYLPDIEVEGNEVESENLNLSE
jgi:hypothetical protein